MLKILATFALIINAFLVMRVKLFFLFCLLCGGIAAQKSATINNVWHESNVTRDGKRGLLIHSDFNVIGMKGYKVQCIISFYDANYNKLKTTYPGYCTTSNTACTHDRDEVTFENSRYSDWPLFIPYEALNLPAGKKTYYYKVFVRDENYNTLKNSQYYAFTASGKNITRMADGSTVEICYNDDGTQTTITRSTCYMCKGTAVCSVCRGFGGSPNIPRNSVYWRPCGACYGSLKCKFCDGKGVTETTMVTDMKTGNFNYYNNSLNNPYHSSGNIYEKQNSSTDDDDDYSRVGCNQCKGEGWYCKYRRTYGSDGKWCKYCQEFISGGIHFRTRCDICKGKGSY